MQVQHMGQLWLARGKLVTPRKSYDIADRRGPAQSLYF